MGKVKCEKCGDNARLILIDYIDHKKVYRCNSCNRLIYIDYFGEV